LVIEILLKSIFIQHCFRQGFVKLSSPERVVGTVFWIRTRCNHWWRHLRWLVTIELPSPRGYPTG